MNSWLKSGERQNSGGISLFLAPGLLLFGLILLVNRGMAQKALREGSFAVTELRRVSLSSAGEEGDDQSLMPAVSADGRFVAFYSLANNLVPSDTNTFIGWDIFVYDRPNKAIELVSVSSTGEQGNGPSTDPDISADGRYVAFSSWAGNLVPGDITGFRDIFVHDRENKTTERVSVSSTGEPANDDSYFKAISGDGRYVAFNSYASNLAPGDTNNVSDVFVHDRETGVTERVSVSSDGNQGSWHSGTPDISDDGRFVVFESSASNLVPGDTNGEEDIFVHDRLTGQTTRVSVNSSGQEANDHNSFPVISGDGQHVAFLSYATNLVEGVAFKPQVYVHDRLTGVTTLASISSTGEVGNGRSGVLAISPDGRFITFGSHATNLIPEDTNGQADVFVHDRLLGLTLRVSITPAGGEGDGGSWGPAIAVAGTAVAFWSKATNLVANDTNQVEDVFVSQWRLYQLYLPLAVR